MPRYSEEAHLCQVQYLPTGPSVNEKFLHKFDDRVGRNYSGDTSRALRPCGADGASVTTSTISTRLFSVATLELE